MREEEIRSASSGSKIDLDGSRRHGKKDAGEGQGKEGGEGGKGGREEGRIGPHRRLGFLFLARAVMSRSLTVVGSAGRRDTGHRLTTTLLLLSGGLLVPRQNSSIPYLRTGEILYLRRLMRTSRLSLWSDRTRDRPTAAVLVLVLLLR